jgi:hypothetical protein
MKVSIFQILLVLARQVVAFDDGVVVVAAPSFALLC